MKGRHHPTSSSPNTSSLTNAVGSGLQACCRASARHHRVPLLILAALALALLWQRIPLLSQPAEGASVAADPNVRTLRVRFGLNDKSPAKWDGQATVTSGQVLRIRNWHPRPGDRVDSTGWSLATRKGPLFVRRAWDEDPVHEPQAPMLIPGVLIDVKGSTATRLTIKTAQGNLTVSPFAAHSAPAGNIAVDEVPTPLELSTTDYQNDFPTIAQGAGREMWMAWVGWKEAGNEIMVRQFDGARWLPPIKPMEKAGDVFIVKLGRDRNNGIWAIWSQQVDGNFDLYGRRYDGKSWGDLERLSKDPQPDIYHNVTTDSSGNLWVVWQGFRKGKSDIFARRFDGEKWLPDLSDEADRVSDSLANDWQPAIAADGAGRVYVAWDTYDQGNYDVRMRSWANGQWGKATAVASTPKFEAHVSLACDKENRLWAAWNESGFNWGKDTGFLVKQQGTRLYQWRTMSVAVWDGSKWSVPASDVNTALPADLQGYNDFPVLQRAADGRMWLFFRHRTLRIRNTASDTPAHRAAWELYDTPYEAKSWGEPLQLPVSMSRMDTRNGFASDSAGNLWAAWMTDNRDFEEFLFQHADVFVGKIASSRPAPPAVLEPRQFEKLEMTRMDPDEPRNLKTIHTYQIANNGKTYHIYRGDTHRHSEFSMDGNNDGSLNQSYRYAIDAAQLDFLAHTDHNGDGGPDNPYISWLLQQMSDLMNLPGTFTPFYSYERSVVYPNGHRNILFATRGVPTLPIPQSEQQGQTGAAALYEYLKKYHGIAISHTSATGMGTDWRDNDPAVEPLVEIYQGDRVSAEYEGAPKAAYEGNPASQPGGFKPKGFVWNAWAKGYKLGTQSASDHLSTHISYACTISPDSTRKGLLDAMRARHSYGATDNIVLDYRLAAQSGKEYLQGDIVPSPGPFKLTVHVIGTQPIRQIDVVCNNKFVFTQAPLQRDVTLTFTNTEQGERYYYVRVIQVDEQMAWSSPIWVRP